MKKFIISIILALIFSVQAFAEGVTLPILLYHNITSEDGNYDPDVHISQKNFKEQIDYLKENNYSTITFRDYYDYRTTGKELPKKPIIITFDDGYRSNYDIAYPYLKEKGMKATIFTVTHSAYIPKTFSYDHFNWAEAKEMVKSGVIDIESHSAGHLIHIYLSYNACLYQARRSFFDIYKNTGKRPFTYAYPTGAFTAESQMIVKDAGFVVQCSVQGKLNDDMTPLNELRRLNIRGDVTLEEFKNLIENSPL